MNASSLDSHQRPFVSNGLAAARVILILWAHEPTRTKVTSRPEMLQRAMSWSVFLLLLGSVIMFLAMLPQEVIGAIHAQSKGNAEPALPPAGLCSRSADPDLYGRVGFRSDGPILHHQHRRAAPGGMVLGELALSLN